MKDLFISINYKKEIVEFYKNQPFLYKIFLDYKTDIKERDLFYMDILIKGNIVFCPFYCLFYVVKRYSTLKEIKIFLTKYPRLLEYFI